MRLARQTRLSVRTPHTLTASTLMGALVFLGPLALGQPRPTPDEFAARERWLAEHRPGKGSRLPFSFRYGGQPSDNLLPRWNLQEEAKPAEEGREQHVYTWRDPLTGLVVRCDVTIYHDFPVIEWGLEFKNDGSDASPILENVLAMDESWARQGQAEFVLYHHRGSQASQRDYEPLVTVLSSGEAKRLSGAGGRPSNTDWPYFDIAYDDGGRTIAVGWPGQWLANFTREGERQLHLQIGQEDCHLRLLAGESIRTPRIVIQFWQGDRIRAHNLWRRWMMKHSMPKPGGQLPPPQFVASSSRAYEEMIHANEENQIMHIRRYLEEGLKPDYWWMDAGWYIQEQGWPQVGTWEVDPRRFPRGFKPISDFAHAHGVKILVWFEPERVMPGTWLYQNHPEWLLSPSGRNHALAGMRAWRSRSFTTPDPNVSCNLGDQVCRVAGIEWTPGRLSFHPGPKGEFSVVRFTAPSPGEYRINARFLAIDQQTTTSVHIMRNNESLFEGKIRLDGAGPEASYQGTVTLQSGETLDFVVGFGNGSYICDSTGLEVLIGGPDGRVFHAAKDFSPEKNPTGVWSYGWMAAGARPDPTTFKLYDLPAQPEHEGPRLLDLGNPEAREWLTNHIDRLITEQGIDLYREDFNIDPLPFWRAADTPDRRGITENHHITGHLAYWDELRRRHPTMLIDSCASGGRRNDLETMRRAVPLWRSDYAYEPIGHQGMTYALSFWLPYHGTGTVAYTGAPYYGSGPTPVQPYAFWSNAAPSLGCGIDIRVKELDYETLRRLYRQFREISPCYYGDYYPLTPYSLEKNVWIAWQFDLPEEGRGMIQAFRRDEAPEHSPLFRLGGLQSDASYNLKAYDSDWNLTETGRTLMEKGFSLVAKEAPSAIVIVYHKVSHQASGPARASE